MLNNSQVNTLVSLNLERYCLSALLKHPEIVIEIDPFIDEQDFFHPVHRTTYAVLREMVFGQEKFGVQLLAQRIKNLSINFPDNIDIFFYLDHTATIPVNRDNVIGEFHELHKLRVCRDLVATQDELRRFVCENKHKPVQEIVDGVDKINNQRVNVFLSHYQGPKDIMKTMKQNLVNIRDNRDKQPPQMMGPFETINRIWGSLHRPGALTVVGARTSVGKTSFGMFYNMYVAAKYNVPLLHLDAGEMSIDELHKRAACCLTQGKVPFDVVDEGTWEEDSEYGKLLNKAFKQVEKIQMFYEDISDLSPEQVINLVRRFYFSQVGRGNPLIIHYDYLKPFDTTDFNRAEWQEMGAFVKKFKALLHKDIMASCWANIQLNRFGITNSRSSAQVDDSENSISISDRITQQTTHTMIIRHKTDDEVSNEEGRFGNMLVKFVKTRHLGKDFKDFIHKVRVAKGVYRQNYLNLYGESFFYKDMGDLKTMVRQLGELYDVQGTNNKPDKPF